MSICPTCKTPLEVISYEGKDVLQCLRCQSFWFTNGQFREIKQIGFSGLYADDNSGQSPRRVSENMSELACPDCAHQILVAYNYAYSSDIQLYRCTDCKGIWAEQHALAEIESLLANYQESLEEAKAKALPLMMEVKRQFQEQEEVREAERKKQKKHNFIGRLFRKKTQREQHPVDIFADLQTDTGTGTNADIRTDADIPDANHDSKNEEETV